MTDEVQKQRLRTFRPSEFMRARRPHLFSDSEVVEQARLDRPTFEYHLETLTARKQELDFERFARKLKCPVPLTPTPKKGPRDLSRETELNELEEQINDPDRYTGLNYQLVEDALQAALLARGIERPRVEVEARFERALHLAEERGTKQQQLRCAYNKAWTYFWWYDGIASFIKVYDAVEKLAHGSSQTSDIELLQNLWQLLYASVKTKDTDAVQARLDERTGLLKSELERIQKQQGRPSAALEAQASQLLMELSISHDDATKLKEALHAFRGIFEKSKGLIDFPAQHFVEVLMELSNLLPDSEEFDAIFESALEVTRERHSRAVSGRMLLRRGSQKLKNGRPYEAIRLLGRAQQDLALQESRGEMVVALGLCGAAYEAAGLLWAARACMLVAANQALKEFWEHGRVSNPALACLRKLIWLELQLGRIPCVLARYF